MPAKDPAFTVKKWQMYVALAIGVLTLGSMLGIKVITPGETAVTALEKKTNSRDLAIAKKHDQDINYVVKEMKDMELRLTNKFGTMLNENNKVLAQMVARQNGN